MRFTYSEFDGDGPGRFLSPDELFPSSNLVNFIIQHGQQALDALRDASEGPDADSQIAQLIEDLVQAGLLSRDEESGALRLTPRMLQGMQHRAFLEIFRALRPGVRDGHPSADPGRAGDRTEGTRPYTFGDPLSELALGETMRNAIRRIAGEETERRRDEETKWKRSRGEEEVPRISSTPSLRLSVSSSLSSPVSSSLLPISFRDSDFELHNVEAVTDTALCILLDLSGSMMRYGRHVAAKRVAMGMRALVKRRFPLDTVDFIGFASTARALRETDIPLVMPEPITTRDWDIRVRVPLDQAEQTHPHFTNLHHALRLARQTLSRRGAANKQLFIITDGEPTAHLSGENHELLNLIYPPSPKSTQATLKEALACTQAGVRFSTFALIEEYHGMDWVGFVDQMTRLTRGVAFYCTAGDLGATIMESYLAGKREKKPLG